MSILLIRPLERLLADVPRDTGAPVAVGAKLLHCILDELKDARAAMAGQPVQPRETSAYELEQERAAMLELQQECWKAQAAIEAVGAERDALKVDAARYRLVRRGQHWSVINGIGDTLTGAALDAATDAKLAAAAPPPDEVELDAWECPECGGHGKRTVYHKVTHQLGTDELPFWETCETCDGIGYCGPDDEKRAAIQAPGAAHEEGK